MASRKIVLWFFPIPSHSLALLPLLSCLVLLSLPFSPPSPSSLSLHMQLCRHSVQVIQSCLTLCNHMDCSVPGFSVHYQLPELIQIHVHWASDTIQPSHPLSSPFPPAFNLAQHQGLFEWVSSSHQVATVLEFQLKHQSFQWIFRVDFQSCFTQYIKILQLKLWNNIQHGTIFMIYFV